MITEAEIWRTIISVLIDGLDLSGYQNIKIKQAYQNQKTGVENNTVYLHKVAIVRRGTQSKSDVYNNTDFDTIESQWHELTIQLNAFVEYEIADENPVTTYDIVDTCSMILQTRRARDLLLNEGFGIYKVSDIRSPHSITDQNQFNNDVSFDFTLTYKQTFEYNTPTAIVDGEYKQI